MKNKNRGGVQLMELDGPDTLLGKRSCSEASCGCAGNTSLNHQALCVDHFLLRCYERLEELDRRGRRFSDELVDMASMLAFIEECSRKALDVSLQADHLSNLQRGRLLDILLWAGELFLLLRAPRPTLAQSIAFFETHPAPRTASPCY